MRLLHAVKCRLLTQVVVLTAIAALLAGCGGGVSEGELEAVQEELQAAQSQVEALNAEKQELQTSAIGGAFEKVAAALSIDAIMAFPPTVVELNPNSATIQMITEVPTTCSIAYGLETDYGRISTDQAMSMGGHTDHTHALRGLQPDTIYHYKWGLLGPDGTLYGSKDLTFKTPPASPGS